MSVVNLIKNIDSQKKIFYNYYNIVSKNISNNDINIQCSFEGKSNTPNIVYLNGSLRQNYISNNLRVFRNEMIIEHNPITNGGKKLYISFPLVTASRIDNTVIDYIIQSKYNDTIEIELNDIIILKIYKIKIYKYIFLLVIFILVIFILVIFILVIFILNYFQHFLQYVSFGFCGLVLLNTNFFSHDKLSEHFMQIPWFGS